MSNDPFIVVIDDDQRICDAIQRLLISANYRVRTFTSARTYLGEHDTLEPDCMIVDIKMPDVDGLTMLLESRASGVEIPAVFITGSADVDAAVRAMKAGASDLLEKPLDDEKLLSALQRALSSGEAHRAERAKTAALWDALETLTTREAQVCALVSTGKLNKQIAAMIGTTEKTVKVHRARAMAKLHVHSVAELVRAVDRLLDDHVPGTIVAADHRHLQKPAAIDVMQLARAGSASKPPVTRRRSKPVSVPTTATA